MVKAIIFVLCGGALLSISQSVASQNMQSLSANGKWLAYVEADALWLVSTAQSSVAEKIAAVSTYFAVPRWAPDGKRLAFYSNASGTLQLWLYDLRTQQSRQISFVDGGITPNPLGSLYGYANDPLRFSWSSDGLQIAFSNQVRIDDKAPRHELPAQERLDEGEPIVLTNDTPPEWTLYGVVSYGHESNRSFNAASINISDFPQAEPPKTTQLVLLNVANGRLRQLTHDTRGYFTPEFSPDGSRLAYMSTEGQSLLAYGPAESNIYILDLATGTTVQVTRGVMQKMIPRWSTDGRRIAYFGKDKNFRPGERSEGVFIVSSDGRGVAVKSSKAIDRRILSFEWAPGGSAVVVSYWDGLYRPLARADLDTGELTPVSVAQSVADVFAASASGIVWEQTTDPNAAALLWFADSKGNSHVITQIRPAPDLSLERRYEPIDWSNSRSETIDGMLIYPLKHEPSKRYPLIVDMYSSVGLDRIDHVNYVRASSSYFLLRSSHRAPHMWVNSQRNAVYDAAAVGANGVEVMVDDVLSGVDVLSRRGLIDPNRMCVVGFSNGGLQGEQLLTQTNRFKCAVLQSPSSSDWLVSFFLATDNSEVIRVMNGVTPWENPSLYTALVPLYHADKIATPILLAVGDREGAIIPTIEMYNVLRYLRKDVTLLRYVTQGHGFSGMAEEDFTKRVGRFFDRYLRDNQ